MSPLQKLISKISAWYDGEFITYSNDTDSRVVFIGGYNKRHWTAQLTRVCFEFYQRNWKWVVTTIISIIAIAAALF